LRKFILIGADPKSLKKDNPGGQATACAGIVSFLNSKGMSVEIIDTTQSSFPVPSKARRLARGLIRTFFLISKLVAYKYDGVIIFSSSGLSFYERIMQARICNFFNTTNVLCIRSGHFMTDVNHSVKYRRRAEKLLQIPSFIVGQGNAWLDFFSSLKVDKEKILTLRNWLQDDFPRAQETKNVPVKPLQFIFIGWLVESKGIVQLLEAARSLYNKDFTFQMKVVGGGDLYDFCRDFVEQNGMSEVVSICGWQDQTTVIDLLKSSDVFVLPSAAEGFPNAMLEAMSLSLPCIVTDVGSVADSLIDKYNGHLLKDNDPKTIEQALREILLNPELIPYYSKNALEIADKNHKAEVNCANLFRVFNV